MIFVIFSLDFFRYQSEVFGESNGTKARHLIFATNLQLSHLSKVKYWYMDGTFKIVKDPFTQIFTINGFLVREEGVFASNFLSINEQITIISVSISRPIKASPAVLRSDDSSTSH